MKTRILAAVALSTAVFSCVQETCYSVHTDSERALLSQAQVPPELDILTIAKQAVAEYGGFECECIPLRVTEIVKLDSNQWAVLVWLIPQTPGGFCVAKIDGEGNVTEIQPGL